MPYFAEFMARLAQRRGLRRQVDGPRVVYRMRLKDTAVATVTTDELDTSARSRVECEPWPVPVTSAAYTEFMRAALAFNRSALHHLPCGIVQDLTNTSLYRLTWRVDPVELADDEWHQRLRLFGLLADKAWQAMPTPGRSLGARRTTGDENHVIFMP
jgi:hypothetical protein